MIIWYHSKIDDPRVILEIQNTRYRSTGFFKTLYNPPYRGGPKDYIPQSVEAFSKFYSAIVKDDGIVPDIVQKIFSYFKVLGVELLTYTERRQKGFYTRHIVGAEIRFLATERNIVGLKMGLDLFLENYANTLPDAEEEIKNIIGLI